MKSSTPTILIATWILLASTLAGISAASAKTVASDEFSYEVTPTPQWVTERVVRKPSITPDSGVSFLILDNQLNLQNGGHTRYQRVSHQINSEQGLQDGAEVYLYFSPDFQTLNLHSLQIERRGEIIDVMEKAHVSLVQQEKELSLGLLTGEVTAILLIPDVRIGDRIDYSYSVDGRNSVYGERRFASFGTRWSVDILDSFVRVITDTSHPLRVNLVNSTGEVETQTLDNRLEYHWHQSDIPKIDDEGEYPSWFDPYGYVEFTEYQNWKEVLDWAVKLFPKDLALDDALAAQNQRWREASQSDQEYVEKVLDFVQNDIRYMGLELGQNSHKPYHPNLVFERKYGDCKDKAYLLSALLREAGIEALPALVSSRSRGAIRDRLPSPGNFDHVISLIKLDDQEYWIDGTRTYQKADLRALGVSDFQNALIIDADQQGLVEVPSPAMQSITRSITEVLVAKDYQQPVDVTIEVTYGGIEAEDMRAYLASGGVASFAKDLLNYYQRIYPNIKANGGLKVSENFAENQLVVTGQFSIEDYWDLEEEKLTIHLYGENLAGNVALPNVMERKMPLALYRGYIASHSLEFHLPEDIDWSLNTEPLVIEDGSIRYQRQVSHEPNRIAVSHQYFTKSDHVPPGQMKTHLKNLRDVKDALYYSVWFANDQATKTNDLRSRLRSALKRKKLKSG